jgi:hypothetical protein
MGKYTLQPALLSLKVTLVPINGSFSDFYRRSDFIGGENRDFSVSKTVRNHNMKNAAYTIVNIATRNINIITTIRHIKTTTLSLSRTSVVVEFHAFLNSALNTGK